MTYNSYLDAYHNYFERPILEATTQYYLNESAQYRSNVTLVGYVNKLEARMEEEERRTELYLLRLGSRVIATGSFKLASTLLYLISENFSRLPLL